MYIFGSLRFLRLPAFCSEERPTLQNFFMKLYIKDIGTHKLSWRWKSNKYKGVHTNHAFKTTGTTSDINKWQQTGKHSGIPHERSQVKVKRSNSTTNGTSRWLTITRSQQAFQKLQASSVNQSSLSPEAKFLVHQKLQHHHCLFYFFLTPTKSTAVILFL